ncbi:MAG: hypothetical protein L6R42_009927 [Xanthoria sp. 1 TBL-2021]|nr:MAG: hypothetical protein L6R42_009927 [Xanthoria sp. 1 TBL-2021]
MYPTLRLLAQQQRTPLIKFLGKRSFPKLSPSSASAPADEGAPPHPHPASPTHDLPPSFAEYRSNAQQHGPLARQRQSESTSAPSQATSRPSSPPAPIPSNRAYGAIGGHSGHSLGSVEPGSGMVMDRTELPRRFWPLSWTEEEIEGVELAGANLKVGWGGS